MNRNNPVRPPTHPALSGEVWDGAAGFDNQSTNGRERPERSKFSRPVNARPVNARPVNADSPPLIFTSREKD
jgi:hypothetical protein